ncbi:MAG: hypothetical protein JWR09_5461 [Mucilaginibacter sp.]|nr:hypothetical protein [Mucilaginibacter sp.]
MGLKPVLLINLHPISRRPSTCADVFRPFRAWVFATERLILWKGSYISAQGNALRVENGSNAPCLNTIAVLKFMPAIYPYTHHLYSPLSVSSDQAQIHKLF